MYNKSSSSRPFVNSLLIVDIKMNLHVIHVIILVDTLDKKDHHYMLFQIQKNSKKR